MSNEPRTCCFKVTGQCSAPKDEALQGEIGLDFLNQSKHMPPPTDPKCCQFCRLRLIREKSRNIAYDWTGHYCDIDYFLPGFELVLCNDELLHKYLPRQLSRIVYSFCGESGYAHSFKDMYFARLAWNNGHEDEKAKYHEVLHGPLLVGAFSAVHCDEDTQFNRHWFAENKDGRPISLVDVLSIPGTENGYLPTPEEPVRFSRVDERGGEGVGFPIVRISYDYWVKEEIWGKSQPNR